MRDVLIIGAGPAGLFAAERLSAKGFSVTVADRMPSPARKFLMAGRGGLNLTHGENLDRFLKRYREAEPFLAPLIRDFPPQALRDWCRGLGEETFVGSSGRVFPTSMKASPLLRAWLRRLDQNGVELLPRRTWTGFGADGTVQLQGADGETSVFPARAVLLALGGASWPRLGSNATWVPLLENEGIHVHRFQPANCGFQIAWSAFLKDRFAGSPLKRIALHHQGQQVAGEAVLSAQGIEGGAVYALSAELREALNRDGSATLTIDLRPDMSEDDLARKLARPRGKQSAATFLKKVLKLKPEEQALLREAGALPAEPLDLARRIKAVPLTCLAPYAIDRAISSAGGIALSELIDGLMLAKRPGLFAAGEMLDWEAPTGGYLLQACFATGARAAEGIAAHLAQSGDK
ncbi:TIGR03862 family flavoprotein [Roseibium sediminicola]|uniref:TIGR03862 family flavoprotein n=1 Tax=Roseibium sediminicola TaxID=2933272 RepID=A0ABT0GMB3_9HYPH|nr:TIGR03862 family flavoprotein [Roseibium sp. CAU 1639]MCK7610562.1 TIGR03862 family flavoprotein [Roseibium sp. CAU 1639]